MRLPRFEYLAPKSLQQACALLDQYPGQAKILAGGTDLLVDMKRKKGHLPAYLIGLKAIPGLDGITYDPRRGLALGPLVNFAALAASSVAKQKFPLLWEAARIFSRVQIRNMGTIIGNLCNASPAADMVPALIALGARARLLSVQGERVVEVDQFCTGPFKTVLRENELVAEVIVPPGPDKYGWSYQRVTKRTVEDEALVITAVMVEFADSLVREARIALGSVAPAPMRARESEAMLVGQALEEGIIERVASCAASETQPRSRAEYRRWMSQYLVKQALHEARQLGGLA